MAEVYRRDGTALMAYARAITRHAHDAEDALQTALIEVLRHPAADISNIRAYLYRAVRNAALNGIRARIRRLRREEGSHQVPREIFQEPSARREELDALNRAMAELSAEQREAVIMKLWGGLSFSEIGTVAGVPRDTAASRYRYAVQALRKQMRPFFNEDV